MTEVENLFIFWPGGIIWDGEVNLGKFIAWGSHLGTSRRDTWTGFVFLF